MLRIRSDAVFVDSRFVNFYFHNFRRTVGSRKILSQRVLVADVFTINPHTIERKAFHFSDWYHFGLRDDVVSLWDVGPMSFADSVYYESNQHGSRTNSVDRALRARLSPEQHIVTGWLARAGLSDLLENSGDLRFVDMSMEILRDNFIVADRQQCQLRFPKYRLDPLVRGFLCLSYSDWVSLTLTGEGLARRAKYILKKRLTQAYVTLHAFPALRRMLVRIFRSLIVRIAK